MQIYDILFCETFFCDLAIFSLHLNFNSFILIASVQNLQKTTLAFLSTKSLDLLRITFCDVDSRFFFPWIPIRNWRTLHSLLHQCYVQVTCFGSYVQSQFLPAVIFPIQTCIIISKTKNFPFLMGKSFANFCKLIDNICWISDGYCWLTLSSSSRISFSGKAFIINSLFTKWKHCSLISIVDGATANSSWYNWGKTFNSVE